MIRRSTLVCVVCLSALPGCASSGAERGGSAAEPSVRASTAVRSDALAAAIARPREHVDAPIEVRDVGGQVRTLWMDAPVLAPAPPDGTVRKTTIRALAVGCADNGASVASGGEAPAGAPECWLTRAFDVQPLAEERAAAPAPTDYNHRTERTLGAIAGGALIVGAIVGSAVCWSECKEPWDSAVPIAAGTATLGILVVGAVLMAPSFARGR